MCDLLPTAFLPHLPRTQSTFSPLQPANLLAHISVLRRLYLPPIHGGLRASDAFYEDEEDWRGSGEAGASKPEAVVSDAAENSGEAEYGGLGFSTGMGIPAGPSRLSRSAVIEEEGEDEGYRSDATDDDWEESDSTAHLDPFERDWAQKWLEGLFRRAQTWIEENDPGDDPDMADGDGLNMKSVEAVLRDATAALAMMAGTSAAGSLTRHLLFPINPDLAPALRSIRTQMRANPDLSPETRTFLNSLSTSPVSPLLLRRLSLSSPPRPAGRARASTILSSTSDASSSHSTSRARPERRSRRARPAIPVLLHDAPMGDHLSVGVQTWGSAILLGREMALRPERFGLNTPAGQSRGVRILELGAGTGLLSILCRKILDIQAASAERQTSEDSPALGLVVATDFLTSVLDNLRVCVDLNFPPSIDASPSFPPQPASGIHIAKLDWTTFPTFMSARAAGKQAELPEEMEQFVNEPFDLVLASDCVYDPTHAEMLRQVAGWTLRLPDPSVEGDQGGTFHILSPLRPTFAPELESIDTHFPTLSSYFPLSARSAGEGEGLGIAAGLKLGVRGEGKRSVRGRKGEGRGDETLGYWWWEVGWG